jgi:threonine aldolase
VQGQPRVHRSGGVGDASASFNASIAAGVAPAAFAATVDSVWVDFTKGLGAPIGAVLAGSRDFIAEARRYKHVFAGAMRQAGIAAAGCLHALDHHVERLAEDHENARRLAAGLSRIEGIAVRNPTPESNMVFFDASASGHRNDAFVHEMLARGVRVGLVRGEIRAVTHLDVQRRDIDTAIGVVAAVARSRPSPSTSTRGLRGY